MTAPPKPRVLVLAERLDLAGGVERFACELANDLSGQGFDVALGSVATPRERVHYPLAPQVRVLHGASAPPQGDGAWAVLRRQWRTGRVLAGLMRRERADAVVLNGLTTACSALTFAPRAAAARSICCDHNHFAARSRPWQALRRRLYRRVAAVVSLTEADRARFEALNPRTAVIRNASSLQAETPAEPRRAEVLAVARHAAQKGLDLLLAAWPAVHAARPDAVLRIIGSGPLTAALHAQAQALGVEASVEWVAAAADMAAEYRAAALFVLPSRYEGMPLALLEAQALGVPAVAFDCPTGPAEIVSPETGVVVPMGDVAALSAAVLRLLNDADLRRRMAQAAIARSRAEFSLDQHRAQWRRLVHDVAVAHER